MPCKSEKILELKVPKVLYIDEGFKDAFRDRFGETRFTLVFGDEVEVIPVGGKEAKTKMLSSISTWLRRYLSDPEKVKDPPIKNDLHLLFRERRNKLNITQHGLAVRCRKRGIPTTPMTVLRTEKRIPEQAARILVIAKELGISLDEMVDRIVQKNTV